MKCLASIINLQPYIIWKICKNSESGVWENKSSYFEVKFYMNYIFPYRKYGLFIVDAPYFPYRLKVKWIYTCYAVNSIVCCKSYYVIVSDGNGDKRCHTSVSAMNINLRCLMERFPLSSWTKDSTIPEKPPKTATSWRHSFFFLSEIFLFKKYFLSNLRKYKHFLYGQEHLRSSAAYGLLSLSFTFTHCKCNLFLKSLWCVFDALGSPELFKISRKQFATLKLFKEIKLNF